MEVFFNELSVKPATNDLEAEQWLIQLAELGQLLKSIVESISEDSFAFRRSDDFAEKLITNAKNIREFLLDHFDTHEPVYNFLYGIFDSPYITEDDPVRTDFELSRLIFQEQDYEVSGLVAAYLKKALAVSLASSEEWDTCDLDVQIKRMDEELNEFIESKNIEHASAKRHIVNCHLELLAKIFDWENYKPKFDYASKNQTILHLLPVYSLLLGEKNWEEFYQDSPLLSPNERVNIFRSLATSIAAIQRWAPATGSLANKNRGKLVYSIPNSNLIAVLDTQHGEFEIHSNSKGNNHLGVISFDGKMKKPISKRELEL